MQVYECVTSLSSDTSKWRDLSDIRKLRLVSAIGCGPGFSGAYWTFLITRFTEFLHTQTHTQNVQTCNILYSALKKVLPSSFCTIFRTTKSNIKQSVKKKGRSIQVKYLICQTYRCWIAALTISIWHYYSALVTCGQDVSGVKVLILWLINN